MLTTTINRRSRTSLVSFLLLLAVLTLPATADAATAKVVAVGSEHVCATTTTGSVRCWGDNALGQLGDGSTTARSTPTVVAGLTGVVSVAAGLQHTCALTQGGGVKCWGANYWGQLGDSSWSSRSTPTDVWGLTSGVTSIVAGDYHTCAVTSGGALKCWGRNCYGQLGDNTTYSRATPAVVPDLANVASAGAGGYHTCAVTTGGALKCWGANFYGGLGDGTTTDRFTPIDVSGLSTGVVSVSAGLYHTCALTTGGGLKCWGYNGSGGLGDGTATTRQTPTEVAGFASGAASVAAADYHTCAVTTAGAVKCWGDNRGGQLGDGTTNWRSTPTTATGLTVGITSIDADGILTCAVTAGGGVRCYGDNYKGQRGDGTTWLRLAPTPVGGLGTGVGAAAVGSYHSCVTTTSGVKCWGLNASGELGDGTLVTRATPAPALGLAGGMTAMRSGISHACVLTTGGGVKCWGANDWGQVGDGAYTYADVSTPANVWGLTSGVSAIGVGAEHTCAVTTGGGVQCWGRNCSGQLGDGTTWSDNRPNQVVGLASGVAAVALGSTHTCALTTGGGVKCWGNNYYGQLGDGTTDNRPAPTDVSGLTSGVAAIAAGANHSCAITTSGGLRCWGDNAYGQLGDGTTTDHLTPADVPGLTSGVASVAVGDSNTCAVTTGGGLKCWGLNGYGQLGDGTTTTRRTPNDVPGLTSGVASVSVRDRHTCAVTTGGAALCWGANGYGEVGDITQAPAVAIGRALGFGQADFDADDRVDVAVYRPSTGTWFSLDSSSANTAMRYRGWGVQAQNDAPVVGDFDGDGILDPTVFRPSTGSWFVLESRAGFTTWKYFGWGEATDTLVPGDYDADGRTDAAVFRPSTGTWYVRPSNGAATWSLVFGQSGDQPVAGDFDGDGKRDPAVYRPSTGTWFWLKSSTNFASYGYKGWGVNAQGDTPAPGDYDGDGKIDPCVFRPATGTWYTLLSGTDYTTWAYFGWGTTGDQVAPADYDGDGKTDGAVYRPTTRTWYVRPSGGAAPWNIVFGDPADLPLVTVR